MTQATGNKSTLEQQRASFALIKVRELQAQGENTYGHYVSYVSSLPATIVMNGLGQALATLLAKAGRKKEPRKDAHYLLYSHVAEWLSRTSEGFTIVPGPSDALIDRLMHADQKTYVRAQVEAMAYLNWLKQFARAYLKEEEGQVDH